MLVSHSIDAISVSVNVALFPTGTVPVRGYPEEETMRVMHGLGVAAIMVSLSMAAGADELKSGPEKKIGGPFDVKAVTGEGKGKTFCYV
jgi:hypothetical protein